MFVYSPLNREFSDIRLVRFKQPASVGPCAMPIELELRHASLDNNTHYAALSYVWGHPDANMAAQIHVNGSLFTIGRNLHVALTQLCQDGVRSWLWVDSICINQVDLEEKSWQVAQMRTIFSQADHVYIWLGPGSNEGDIAMDFASRVGPRALAVGVLDLWSNQKLKPGVVQYLNERISSLEVQDRNDKSSMAVKELADFMFDILHEPDLQKGGILKTRNVTNAGTNLKVNSLARGIRDLMQREYWHRIWIIQEISLPKEAIVLCGKKTIPLEIFDAAFSAVSHCIHLGLRYLTPETEDFAYSLSANFYESIALTVRRQHRRQDHSDMIRIGGIVFRYGVPPGRPHYSATDARDIVFGLLGVITDGEALGLRANYNMTLAEVFTALTRTLIYDKDENSVAYHLDRYTPRREENSPLDSLPTWVPDWREMGKRGSIVHPINYFGEFNATAGIPTPTRPSSCSEDDVRGLLRCQGCRVDVITDVMQPPEWKQSDDWTASRIVDTEGWLASIRDFAELGPESGPGEDYVWRTIMMDRYNGVSRPNRFETKPLSEEKVFIIRKIMRREPIVLGALTEAQQEYIGYAMINQSFLSSKYETLDKQLEYMITEWPKIIGSVNRGRTLFKTNKGMFGLGHIAIRPGDFVTLLWGLQSPIVLRPRNDREGAGFTFVGDAYVDGIMYGEFLKTAPAHEDFEIY